jgi:hypothetical protein
MADKFHPTNRSWELFDPAVHVPPRGVNLLLINEGGVLIIGTWYKGALAWGYKPVIPATVKARLTKQKQQSESQYGREPTCGSVDPTEKS